jgi:hypothetical protein
MATRTATKAALEAGFRQLDASERYRNEKEVGKAMQEMFMEGVGWPSGRGQVQGYRIIQRQPGPGERDL